MSRPSAQVDRARRRIRADLIRAVDDVATARRGAGLSLRTVGGACGFSRSAIDRMESHRADSVDVVLLASMAAVVGLDVRLRAYPAGDPLRDAGQLRLLARLRERLRPDLGWRTEVPLPIDGDRRAWDALIQGTGWQLAVEAETVLDDLQAIERRLALKLRDGGQPHVLLLVADTRHNRRVLASAGGSVAQMPVRTRELLRALRDGRDPRTGGIVVI